MAESDLTKNVEELSEEKTEVLSASGFQKMESDDSGVKSPAECTPGDRKHSDSSSDYKMKCEDTAESLIKSIDTKAQSSSIDSKLPDDFATDESCEQATAAETGDQQLPQSNIDSPEVLTGSPDPAGKDESKMSEKCSVSASSKVKEKVCKLVDKIKNLGSPRKKTSEEDENVKDAELSGEKSHNPGSPRKKTRAEDEIVKDAELSGEKSHNLGSPRKRTRTEDENIKDSELPGEKFHTAKKFAFATGAEPQVPGHISADDIESSSTSHEIEPKKGDQLNKELTPPKMSLAAERSEQPKKKSPLKNLFEKCKDLIGSPKKSAESKQIGESSTENRPASLELDTSDASSKRDKNVLQSVFDKTKTFFKMGSQLSDEFSSSSDSERHYLDTPHSGVLGDISDTSTSTMTGSSSEASADSRTFEGQISKKPAHLEFVAEVPCTQQPAAIPQLKKVKDQEPEKMSQEDVDQKTPGCFSQSLQKKTPPLERQKKVEDGFCEPSCSKPSKNSETENDTIEENMQSPSEKDDKSEELPEDPADPNV